MKRPWNIESGDFPVWCDDATHMYAHTPHVPYEAALRLARIGLWSYSVLEDRVDCSPLLAQVLSLKPEELQIPFERFLRALPEEDQARMLTAWQRVLTERLDSFELKHDLVLGARGTRRVYQRCQIDWGLDGTPHRVWGIVQDTTHRTFMETQLRASEQDLDYLHALAPVGIVLSNDQLDLLEFNDAFCRLVGADRASLRGASGWQFIPPARHAEWRAALPHVATGSRIGPLQVELLDRQQRPIAVALHGRFLQRADGERRLWTIVEDVSDRREADEQARQWASVFQHTTEGIVITDATGTIVDVNPSFTRITGYPRDEAVGKSTSLLRSGRHDPSFYAAMWTKLDENGRWSGEIWNRRRDGEIYAEHLTISAVRGEQGRVHRYIGLFSDITNHKTHEHQLQRIAHYDALTGLPNRLGLVRELQRAMERARRGGTRMALVYLDLDDFKTINDTWGHESGDHLIVRLAERIRTGLRATDALTRPGGDEFAVILEGLSSDAATDVLVQRLRAAVSAPLVLQQHPIHITASAGITFYPQLDPTIDPDQLLRQADQAMYQAKTAGRNRSHVFDAAEERATRGHYQQLGRIREALENDEFVLYYQPRVHLRTGQVMGAEALIRWQHPERGLVLPGEFLPLVHRHPLAIEIGEWVLRTALAEQRVWRSLGVSLPVSVNIDGDHLQLPTFIDRLRHQLSLYPEFARGDLELEILEHGALQQLDRVRDVLRACDELGVHCSIDDFGTGYSSLAYLKQLPGCTLKIDQTFVRGMLDDPDDLAVLNGVLGMAQAFGRTVVAEGVETREHGEYLLLLGCEFGQGYGIARPMPGEEIVRWSQTWTPFDQWTDAPFPHRRNGPVIRAMTEHRAWQGSVLAFLSGTLKSMPPLDPAQCAFGRWLTDARADDEIDPSLAEDLDRLHRAVHAAARRLVDAASPGEIPPTAELDDANRALGRALRTLLAQPSISSKDLQAAPLASSGT